MLVALGLILLVVLLGPLLSRPIERNIEVFFLGAGLVAAAVSGQLGRPFLNDALAEPLGFATAVVVFGAITRLTREVLDRSVERLRAMMPTRWIYFVLAVALGLLSSVITNVIAALILVEAISLLRLDRRSEIAAVVVACFAIGLGAALTPVASPLSAIAIAALHADFWYLARLLGPLVIAGILIVGLVSLALPAERRESAEHGRDESWGEIALRGGKVYIFVAGLVGLSWAFRPFVDTYINGLPLWLLFWLNSISAAVDNATLTAVEIGPSLGVAQQRAVLMSLLISGGMLIPGNIPNIVAAGRLGITSREWARVGLMIGLPLMLLCFLAIQALG
jgi:predicted cation transporter